MKTKIFTLLILLSYSCFSQPGWVPLNTNTGNNLNSVIFINANTGYAVGDTGTIIKTTNAGLSWVSYPTGINDNLVSVHFPSVNTGYVIGGFERTFLKTTNGGITWISGHVNSSFINYSVFFVNDLTGYVSNGMFDIYGAVFKTTNGGNSWDSTIIAMEPLFSVYFTDVNTGYLAGGDYEFGSLLYKTTNGGLNWIKQPPNNFGILKSIYFTQQNPLLGISVGTGGLVLRTTDGSLLWTQQNINSDLYLNSVHFPDVNAGYIAGDRGAIFRTTNTGQNWTWEYTGTKQWLNSIYFTEANTGYAAGNKGIILKTTNGGVTPTFSVSGLIRYQDNNLPVNSGKVRALKYDPFTQEVLTVDSAVIQSNGIYTLPKVPQDSVDIMAFQDDEEMASFVPTYYVSTIYWQGSTTIYPVSNLNNIDINVFRNSSGTDNFHIRGNINIQGSDLVGLKDACIYAKSGNLYKGYSVSLTNGNYSIDKLSNGSYDIIVDRMGFVSSQIPAMLNNSHIDNLNFTLQQYLIGIDPPGGKVPENFWLGQNYPNPFNPETEINFGLPKETYVTLKIYDILGRETATLVNEELNAGEYHVKWNASALSSGVYFYRLEAGSIVLTKKLAIIK